MGHDSDGCHHMGVTIMGATLHHMGATFRIVALSEVPYGLTAWVALGGMGARYTFTHLSWVPLITTSCTGATHFWWPSGTRVWGEGAAAAEDLPEFFSQVSSKPRTRP